MTSTGQGQGLKSLNFSPEAKVDASSPTEPNWSFAKDLHRTRHSPAVEKELETKLTPSNKSLDFQQ